MVTPAIHRIIEHVAATRGDAVAVAGECQALTYRALNQRANLVARRLNAAGFHRSGHALVQMPRGVDLAVVLLAVLKAGSAYTWKERSADERALTIARAHDDHQRISVDIAMLLDGEAPACPNLPILTRETDTACVLCDDAEGAGVVLVPHATVAFLRARALPATVRAWRGDAGALDLWILLMAGGTAVLETDRTAAAA